MSLKVLLAHAYDDRDEPIPGKSWMIELHFNINFSYLGDGQNEVLSIFAKLKSIFQDDGSGAEIN